MAAPSKWQAAIDVTRGVECCVFASRIIDHRHEADLSTAVATVQAREHVKDSKVEPQPRASQNPTDLFADMKI